MTATDWLTEIAEGDTVFVDHGYRIYREPVSRVLPNVVVVLGCQFSRTTGRQVLGTGSIKPLSDDECAIRWGRHRLGALAARLTNQSKKMTLEELTRAITAIESLTE